MLDSAREHALVIFTTVFLVEKTVLVRACDASFASHGVRRRPSQQQWRAVGAVWQVVAQGLPGGVLVSQAGLGLTGVLLEEGLDHLGFAEDVVSAGTVLFWLVLSQVAPDESGFSSVLRVHVCGVGEVLLGHGFVVGKNSSPTRKQVSVVGCTARARFGGVCF